MEGVKSILLTLLTGVLFRFAPDVTIDVADEEYDFVVVGGGATGCAVASRLSEDTNTKVLLIEAGRSDAFDPDVHIPGRAVALQETDAEWNYKYTAASNAQDRDQHLERVEKYVRGKLLGGCSSTNFMNYFRGSRHDYDSWEDHGAEGWNFDSVEKIFRKIENAKAANMSERLGRNGPLRLTRNHHTPSPYYNLIMGAADELGIERGDSSEIAEGLSHTTRSIYRGLRQNCPTAYLRPNFPKREERLHILTDARVTKILIERKTLEAYGVKYTKGGKNFIVRARKEVILSAGAINTPQLLMLSGIGPREELEKFDIDVLKDLPGVGSNMQDHFMVENFYTMDNILVNATGLKAELEQEGIETDTNKNHMYLSARTSYFNTPISLSNSKRPFPEVALVLNEAIDDTDSKKLKMIISVLINHPKSTGTISLRSSDSRDPPIIQPNQYADEDDVKIQLAGFRLLEKLENTRSFRAAGARYETRNVCAEFFSPDVPRSEEFYRCLIDQAGMVMWHACCTTKIGRKNDGLAVVDPSLRVYGVKHLRIADASVMPHITTSYLQAPCYMIGEKAAAMIKKRWE